MLFVCREGAGFEPAAGVPGMNSYSDSGVQSCQGPSFWKEKRDVSGIVQKVASEDIR